ncbi:MAG: YgiT-type zinc finger protein [Acidimicrobiales bacterium]|nr:YgiT-type zinc finger protein [Acidimicrobiales bacterium]
MSDVPMQECPACGERWISLEVAERLDAILHQLISSGAETATGHWDSFTSSVA